MIYFNLLTYKIDMTFFSKNNPYKIQEKYFFRNE